MRWNDLIGRRLGPYHIIDELGRGGSARVYRAHQEDVDRTVAIKVMATDVEDRDAFYRRFEREVETVAHLNHPNIVAVYDSGQLDDLVYLVMQCVTGGTFRQRLGQPIPIGDACAAIIQMARALQHAHTRGIVHRDVKPSNMLIDRPETGLLLLTDFGIAKLQGIRGLTKSGTTIGTPEYMAPEQAEGREIDPRADVYSLGCVLYEALAGRAPFIGATPVSVLYQQVHTRPDYIRGLNPQVPRELARVVEVALAKQPQERFSSAESLAQALHPFASGRERGPFSAPLSSAPFAGAPFAGAPRRGEAPVGELDLRSSARGSGSWPRLSASAQSAQTPTAATGETETTDSTPPPLPSAPEPGRPRLHGLGTEGLDALFPDDPEAQAVRAGEEGEEGGAGAHTTPGPGAPPASQTSAASGSRPTIPLAAFRLPARAAITQPFELPLNAEGLLDIEALMTQVDQPTVRPPAPRSGPRSGPAGLSGRATRQSAPSGEPGANPSDPWNPMGRGGSSRATPPGQREPDARAFPTASAYPSAQQPPNYAGDPADWGGMVDLADSDTVTDRLGVPPPARPPGMPEPPTARARRVPSRVLLAAGVLLVVVTLGATAWAALAARPGVVRHSPTPVPTSTATPLPTATPSPSGTAGPTQQQLLDRQARAAFSGINLAPYSDGSCASADNVTSFTTAQSVHVNLCVAQSVPSGTFSVVLRLAGTTLTPMARNVPLTPSWWYVYYNLSNSLAPGTYDILVTVGGGTAADLTFKVTG